MFADDIVILSESNAGLQNSLNKLHAYCSKWNLTVNSDNTKVVIFNKGGHILVNYSFVYGPNTIDIVSIYCYLGIMFTASGSFTEAIKCLYNKASKAFFKNLKP